MNLHPAGKIHIFYFKVSDVRCDCELNVQFLYIHQYPKSVHTESNVITATFMRKRQFQKTWR